MDEDTFQTLITQSNISNKEALFRATILDELRLNIYTFLISRETEEDDFDLTKYIEKLGDILYIDPVLNALKAAGWKYTISFGDTALFVYTGDRPARCW